FLVATTADALVPTLVVQSICGTLRAARNMEACMDTRAVDVERVTKRYGDLVAVNEVTLQVEAGSVYGVLGPNGAGKTTLLRMLFGLISPDTGSISLFGKSWDKDGTRVLDGAGGFIESPKFYPYLSGRKNLVGLGRLDGGVDNARIDEVLALVDLKERQHD